MSGITWENRLAYGKLKALTKLSLVVRVTWEYLELLKNPYPTAPAQMRYQNKWSPSEVALTAFSLIYSLENYYLPGLGKH